MYNYKCKSYKESYELYKESLKRLSFSSDNQKYIKHGSTLDTR